jgi:hypothetical protein
MHTSLMSLPTRLKIRPDSRGIKNWMNVKRVWDSSLRLLSNRTLHSFYSIHSVWNSFLLDCSFNFPRLLVVCERFPCRLSVVTYFDAWLALRLGFQSLVPLNASGTSSSDLIDNRISERKKKRVQRKFCQMKVSSRLTVVQFTVFFSRSTLSSLDNKSSVELNFRLSVSILVWKDWKW